jgi:hypothetical protein
VLLHLWLAKRMLNVCGVFLQLHAHNLSPLALSPQLHNIPYTKQKSHSTMTMKSSLLFAAAAALANAQSIIECNPSTSQLCANDFNRTCYNYTLTSTHDCTTCLNGFIEYDDECYSIVDLQNGQFFNIVSKMIEMYTPEYADTTISTEERAYRLLNVSSIISYWESLVPTVEFSLKLNSESVLTLEERVKRLGVNNAITFDLDNQVDDVGRGGIMERFIVEGVNDELDDVAADGAVDSSATNPSSRRLAGAAATNTKNNQFKTKQAHRRMQDTPPAIDWHSSGYTTTVKNQGYCGCCWAVSTTAAIESALMITNKMNKFDAMTSNSLSFQQMISCDESNLGCDGGNIVSVSCFNVIAYLFCVHDLLRASLTQTCFPIT